MARPKTGIDLYRAASAEEKRSGPLRNKPSKRLPGNSGGTKTGADSGAGSHAGRRRGEGTGDEPDAGFKVSSGAGSRTGEDAESAARAGTGSQAAVNAGRNAGARGPGGAGGSKAAVNAGRQGAAGRPEGLIKTIGTRGFPSGSKAARFLLLLGPDEAAGVVSRLTPEEVEALACQIAEIRRIDTVEARALLEEFGARFADVELRRVSGGKEAARALLSAAFGTEKAESILSKALPEDTPAPFYFLNDLSFNQLVSLLRKEPPRTLALVMPYLEPQLASALLESLPDEERLAVVLRMARTEEVSRTVVATVENTLREKLTLIGKDDSELLDGRSALADILRHMPLDDERRILGSLEEADSSLAFQVKEKLYTMDSVLHLREKDLQQLLLEMDEKDIAMILKGQTPEVRICIESALSSRRRLLVEDEGVLLGPQPRSEVDRAVKAFLEKMRSGEEEGRFIILREEADLLD